MKKILGLILLFPILAMSEDIPCKIYRDIDKFMLMVDRGVKFTMREFEYYHGIHSEEEIIVRLDACEDKYEECLKKLNKAILNKDSESIYLKKVRELIFTQTLNHWEIIDGEVTYYEQPPRGKYGLVVTEGPTMDTSFEVWTINVKYGENELQFSVSYSYDMEIINVNLNLYSINGESVPYLLQ